MPAEIHGSLLPCRGLSSSQSRWKRELCGPVTRGGDGRVHLHRRDGGRVFVKTLAEADEDMFGVEAVVHVSPRLLVLEASAARGSGSGS